MARLKTVTVEPEGLIVWLEYNPANRRVTEVGWDNPSGRVIGWEVRIGEEVESGEFAPGSSGSFKMRGNFTLEEVEYVDDDGVPYTALELPAGVTYRFWVV